MLAAVVLVGLVLVAGLSEPYGLRGAVLLAAVSLLWLLVNGPMDGITLLPLSHGHGVTAGDLGAVAGLGLAAYRFSRVRPPRSDRTPG